MSLDFITELPSSHKFTTILVVMDYFSKGAHFGALPPRNSAYKTALLFLDMVCKHHGFPQSLVSDWDSLFVSNFWKELFRLSGTKLRMSTMYHPQTGGQIEVINRILEQYLRTFVHDRPSQWDRFLSLAECSYNTSTHSGTVISPFEAIYGKPPLSIAHYILGDTTVEVVDSLLTTPPPFSSGSAVV